MLCYTLVSESGHLHMKSRDNFFCLCLRRIETASGDITRWLCSRLTTQTPNPHLLFIADSFVVKRGYWVSNVYTWVIHWAQFSYCFPLWSPPFKGLSRAACRSAGAWVSGPTWSLVVSMLLSVSGLLPCLKMGTMTIRTSQKLRSCQE